MIRLALTALSVLLLAGCNQTKSANRSNIRFDPSWQSAQPLKKKANLTGYIIDFVLSLKPESTYEFASETELLYQLENKECDAIFTGAAISPFNTGKFSCSEPLIYTGPVIVLREPEKAASFAALSGKQIGLERNSAAYLLAQQVTTITLAPYDNIAEAFEDLSQGRIDVILVDALVAMNFCSGVYTGKLHISSPPLTDAGIRLVTRKNTQKHLIEQVNKLSADKQRLQALRLKWGLVQD